MKVHKRILPLIIISQFFCTSLWFAGNGVMNELIDTFHLNETALGSLTSMVQFGFISGTLLFSLLSIADRHSPSLVFFTCACLGSIFNACIIWPGNDSITLLGLRFLTGFFLAGIYPVGMKIAADYFDQSLGKSLGFLVGALVVGTGFPHLLQELKGGLSWQFVIIITSILAILGGCFILLLVPDGPFRKKSQKIKLFGVKDLFKHSGFKGAAFGYFGHMWELYAFWTFVPVLLQGYNDVQNVASLNIPLWSFIVIAIGGIACMISGYLSLWIGTRKTAMIALGLSCVCCIVSPLMILLPSKIAFISFLLFWGMVVIADSPLFSTLVAQNAPNEQKGTALTIVNCIGFSITIVSIQLINSLRDIIPHNFILLILSLGPILGLITLQMNTPKAYKNS